MADVNTLDAEVLTSGSGGIMLSIATAFAFLCYRLGECCQFIQYIGYVVHVWGKFSEVGICGGGPLVPEIILNFP